MQAEARKAVCAYCDIVFAQAEDSVVMEGKVYHKECGKKHKRDRIKELFLRNCAEHGLTIVPHHPKGR